MATVQQLIPAQPPVHSSAAGAGTPRMTDDALVAMFTEAASEVRKMRRTHTDEMESIRAEAARIQQEHATAIQHTNEALAIEVAAMQRAAANVDTALALLYRGGVVSDAQLADPSEGAAALIAGLLHGDVCRLRPGVYVGPFDVPAGVTVCGDGADGVTFVCNDASRDVVTLHAGATLRGVSVEQRSSDASAVRLMAAASDAAAGSSTTQLDVCVLSSNNRPAIVAAGAVSLAVSACALRTRRGATGLLCSGGATVTMDKSNCSGELTTAPTATALEASSFASSDAAMQAAPMLSVVDRGTVLTATAVTIVRHAGPGVQVRAGGRAVLRGCRVAECRGCGLDAADGDAVLTAEACSVAAVADAGVQIASAAVTLVDCDVRDSLLSNIVVTESVPLARISGDSVGGTQPLLTRCIVTGSKQYGVLALRRGAELSRDATVTTTVVQHLTAGCRQLDGNVMGPVKVEAA